jgi:ferredoxin
MYRITIDRDACDGVFACLVRDPRFVEDAAGLAAVDPDSALDVEESEGRVVATFEGSDERLADAESAAAACPLDAITVETEVA